MERLTRKSNTSSMVWFVDHERGNADREPCEMDPHHARLAITRLAEYEDLEEQGKLLKLPCAVGEPVWLIRDKRKTDYKISGYAMDHKGISIIFLEKEVDGKMYERSIDYTELGKTAFFTEEKADQAYEALMEVK